VFFPNFLIHPEVIKVAHSDVRYLPIPINSGVRTLSAACHTRDRAGLRAALKMACFGCFPKMEAAGVNEVHFFDFGIKNQ